MGTQYENLDKDSGSELSESIKFDARLAHCYILGFEWAIVVGKQIEAATRQRPEQVPEDGQLIHLATYQGVRNEQR